MRILVTGGAGLIGRACVKRLLAQGDNVVLLDLRASSVRPAARLRLVEGDLLDRAVLRKSLEGVRGIVHLAAVSRVQDAEENKERAYRTNVEGTALLLREAGAAKHAPFLVHASSREVYGEPERIPVGEYDAISPVNTYGKTKLEAEHLAREYADENSVGAWVLRFANVYGSIHDQPRRVIPIFARKALQGEILTVNDGTKTFDFVHVSDASAAISRALAQARTGKGGDGLYTYNIATGKGTSLSELARLICKAARSRSKIKEGKAMDYDVHTFVGDPKLAKDHLGFRAKVGIEDGVGRTVAAFRKSAA